MIDRALKARLTDQLKAVERWSTARHDRQPDLKRRDIYARLIRYARHYRKQVTAARTKRKLDALADRIAKIQLLAAKAYERDLPRGGL